MYPRITHLGPIPLPFPIYSFGLLVVIGFAAGVTLAARLARQRRLPGEAFMDVAVFALFASIAGARLLYVALNWHEYSHHPISMLYLWEGGMSFHGGLAGGLLAGVLAMRRQGLPVLAMADAAAPGLALGYAIGRVGCLLNGCCYGGPTDLPWGMHFNGPHTDPNLLYHPTQIYASIINLGVMGLLIWAYYRPHRAGQVLALYVGFYSIYRFFIEGLRKGQTADVLAYGYTQAQAFSILAIVGAALWWWWLQKRSEPAPDLAPLTAPTAPAQSQA